MQPDEFWRYYLQDTLFPRAACPERVIPPPEPGRDLGAGPSAHIRVRVGLMAGRKLWPCHQQTIVGNGPWPWPASWDGDVDGCLVVRAETMLPLQGTDLVLPSCVPARCLTLVLPRTHTGSFKGKGSFPRLWQRSVGAQGAGALSGVGCTAHSACCAWLMVHVAQWGVECTARGAHSVVHGVQCAAQGVHSGCSVRGAQHARRSAGYVVCSVQCADLLLPLALSEGQEGKCCRSCCFHRRSSAPKPAQILISVGKQRQGLLSPWPAGDAFSFRKLYHSPQPLINHPQ